MGEDYIQKTVRVCATCGSERFGDDCRACGAVGYNLVEVEVKEEAPREINATVELAHWIWFHSRDRDLTRFDDAEREKFKASHPEIYDMWVQFSDLEAKIDESIDALDWWL